MSDLLNSHSNLITEDEDIAQLKVQIALMQKGVNEDNSMGKSSTFQGSYSSVETSASGIILSPSASSGTNVVVPPEKEEADRRSIHVAQVDYSTTADQLQMHFSQCGSINRVNIMIDKYTHQPKGFAYLEFATVDAAHAALTLNDSIINNRQIKVTPKRTNIPGLSAFRGRGRGAGRGGRGAGRGGYNMPPYGAPYYNYPYTPASFVAPYTSYPYPPPPPPMSVTSSSFYGPAAPHQGYQQAGGAFRRGSSTRGCQRFSPYSGGSDRRGRGRGDNMFIPNDNNALPRMDHGSNSAMSYGQPETSSYPVEEPSSSHF